MPFLGQSLNGVSRATSKKTGRHTFRIFFRSLFAQHICHHQPSLSSIMNHQEAKFDTSRSDRNQGRLVHSPIFYISHPFILKIPGKPWGKHTHTTKNIGDTKKTPGDEVVLDDNQPAGLLGTVLTYQGGGLMDEGFYG